MRYIFFIIFNFSILYGIQDELVKDAFLQFDTSQQKLICQGIKQQGAFVVANNATQMIKIQGDGRVRIFKGKYNFEVLTSAFSKLCSK